MIEDIHYNGCPVCHWEVECDMDDSCALIDEYSYKCAECVSQPEDE